MIFEFLFFFGGLFLGFFCIGRICHEGDYDDN
jgi:hypothetical protein